MRILLVEDNARLGEATREGLTLEGNAIDLTASYESGLSYAETEDYDLIILDRRLPGGKDGLDLCVKLREDGSNVPILMLTALGDLDDKITGLKNGADDYLVKPFELAELTARVEALTRRPHQLRKQTLQIGAVRIDAGKKAVFRHKQRVDLTRREYAILEYLMTHNDTVVSKQELIGHIWDFDADVLPNTVEVFILNLRKKLDTPDQPSVIETVRGFGYKLRI